VGGGEEDALEEGEGFLGGISPRRTQRAQRKRRAEKRRISHREHGDWRQSAEKKAA
jgi:hypothetical protein